MVEVLGGSYREVKGSYPSEHTYEAHHVFAYSAYKGACDLNKNQGPSIRMESTDHEETASWDHRDGATEYRTEQRSLIEQGKFGDAWMKDVNDIRSKFGTKYDEHLVQAESHLLKLDAERKIQLEQAFKAEIEKRQDLQKEIEIKRTAIEQAETNEQNQKAADLKELEAKRAEAFEKANEERQAQQKQLENQRIEVDSAQQEQKVTQNREAEARQDALLWKLRLSNEAGESKVLLYKFSPGETRPELTDGVKEELWKLPERSFISRQTVEQYQQQINVSQQKTQSQSDNYRHGMGMGH
jgi:hypothetical protein